MRWVMGRAQSEDGGYIKLHRKFYDCQSLQPKGAWGEDRAFLWMVARANWQDNRVRIDGELFDVKRGEFITSIRNLRKKWGWGVGKVYRFINILKSEHMVEHKPEHRYTRISICNYDVYNPISEECTDEAERGAEREAEQSRNDPGTIPERSRNQRRIIKNKEEGKINYKRELRSKDPIRKLLKQVPLKNQFSPLSIQKAVVKWLRFKQREKNFTYKPIGFKAFLAEWKTRAWELPIAVAHSSGRGYSGCFMPKSNENTKLKEKQHDKERTIEIPEVGQSELSDLFDFTGNS
jgi:hypothetical protein